MEFFDLLYQTDALVLSISIALTFIIAKQLSVVHRSLVHRSNHHVKQDRLCYEKRMTDSHLVQNYCFIRDEIARTMFRKETPDDKEGHVYSLFA
ncbi:MULTISPECIES: hypothetical protein [Fictibacillus]|jgi:hypothetical protein|uniref:hypothetical protein n=1 Tax=Fictibacillus TaxID=1329200 RepID=UPI0018CF9798|nr:MULTISPECIES: hypothetical protein [unclassified Fictibacillus]MBH0156481.1 hypothetical protein [Fictibacillus sp. 5RED26]MBH0161976.1 hypothetical protein [Fictibacillus sp. 26RED30]MBH0164338.1 hypothetical protein [Fictibacillus sp. 7GRE50]MBH0175541.1 hypothetical protein [Fictibacillus sp. 23RED33]